MASANDIAVESAEGFELSMPESGDRACAGEVILHGDGTNLGNVDVPHGSAKGIEDDGFCSKAHPQRSFERNVFGGELRKSHDHPPKSTSATSRNSARFTFA